jgi:hypothetical protein
LLLAAGCRLVHTSNQKPATSLPFHQINFINKHGFLDAKDGDDERQADGDFSGGDHHDKKYKNLTFEIF